MADCESLCDMIAIVTMFIGGIIGSSIVGIHVGGDGMNSFGMVMILLFLDFWLIITTYDAGIGIKKKGAWD